MEIISFLIHAYLYLQIYELLTEEYRQPVKWLFVLLFGGIKYIAGLEIYTKRLVPFLLCTLLILYSVCIRSNNSNLKNLKFSLVAYGIDYVINILMGSLCGIVAGLLGIRENSWMNIIISVGRIAVIIALYKGKVWFVRIKQSWILYIGVVAAIVFLFTEQIIRVAYVIDNKSYINIAIACTYLATLFTILWIIDHYKMVKIQEVYVDDNKQMSQKLHRSKEIIPLLANYASTMDAEQDPKMREKLQDICRDYGKELGGQELSAGLFYTTGIELLDLLLQSKVIECTKQDIELNVFVNDEIDKDMKRLGIGDGELTRMMGDLLQNAVHAVLKTASVMRMILVVIARGEEGYVEFHIHDSGVPFPQKVLDSFGQRGNTTWGTGNGIADLMETLNRVNASIRITHSPDPEDIFTKEICICFDGKARVELNNQGDER